MKFINLALVALSSISLVFGQAQVNPKVKCNDQLCFKEKTSTTVAVTGLASKNKNAKSVTIPSSVRLEGRTYTVDEVNVFAFIDGCNFQDLTFSSGINKILISDSSFYQCPNLKRVTFSCKNVNANYLSPFQYVHKDITFLGQGVKKFTDSQVKLLLKNTFTMSSKTYTDTYNYERKTDLFDLGAKVANYLKKSNVSDAGNAISAIKTQYGNSAGYARLYRLLAIAMGVKSNEILVAWDGSSSKYWNYVKVDNEWVNVDIYSYPYNQVSHYYEAEWKKPFFLGSKDFKKGYTTVTVSPSSWRVMLTNYGYRDEFRGQQDNDFIDTYLRQNNLGNRKN